MGAYSRTWNAGILLFPTSTRILSIPQAPFQLELLHNLLLVHPMKISHSLLAPLGFFLQIPEGDLWDFETLKKKARGELLVGFQPSWNVPHPFLAGGSWSRKVLKGPVATTKQQLPTTSGK